MNLADRAQESADCAQNFTDRAHDDHVSPSRPRQGRGPGTVDEILGTIDETPGTIDEVPLEPAK